MELITQNDCKDLLVSLKQANERLMQITSVYKPIFNGEHYLTGEEVCVCLHISKRTLQEYRDSMLIPYISLFGKMLYKESDIQELLDKNYVKAFTPL